MREKLLLSGIAIIASCALCSCISEEVLNREPSVPADQKEAKFSSNIIETRSSDLRVSGSKWESGDAIGIFMIEEENYTVFKGKSNIKYVTEYGGYTGDFIPEGDKIYFPNDGREVRFMSYYPYNKAITGTIYNVDISNQFPQSNIELLYSFNTSATYNKNIEIRKVPIEFDHQLTKVYINVKNGTGLQGSDLMHLKVTLSGLSTKANFNLLTGKLNNFSGTAPISPSVLIAGGGNVYSCEAVVIPEANMSNAKIVFNLNNGKVYTWNIDRGFEKGKQHTYNATISNTGITVNSIVNNWHNVNMEETVSLE